MPNVLKIKAKCAHDRPAILPRCFFLMVISSISRTVNKMIMTASPNDFRNAKGVSLEEFF